MLSLSLCADLRRPCDSHLPSRTHGLLNPPMVLTPRGRCAVTNRYRPRNQPWSPTVLSHGPYIVRSALRIEPSEEGRTDVSCEEGTTDVSCVHARQARRATWEKSLSSWDTGGVILQPHVVELTYSSLGSGDLISYCRGLYCMSAARRVRKQICSRKDHNSCIFYDSESICNFQKIFVFPFFLFPLCLLYIN